VNYAAQVANTKTENPNSSPNNESYVFDTRVGDPSAHDGESLYQISPTVRSYHLRPNRKRDYSHCFDHSMDELDGVSSSDDCSDDRTGGPASLLQIWPTAGRYNLRQNRTRDMSHRFGYRMDELDGFSLSHDSSKIPVSSIKNDTM
jgi:hypothetical protein